MLFTAHGCTYDVRYTFFPCDGTVLPGESAPAETVQVDAVFLGDCDVSSQLDLATLNRMANAARREVRADAAQGLRDLQQRSREARARVRQRRATVVPFPGCAVAR